jgi:hypothetical protein
MIVGVAAKAFCDKKSGKAPVRPLASMISEVDMLRILVCILRCTPILNRYFM